MHTTEQHISIRSSECSFFRRPSYLYGFGMCKSLRSLSLVQQAVPVAPFCTYRTYQGKHPSCFEVTCRLLNISDALDSPTIAIDLPTIAAAYYRNRLAYYRSNRVAYYRTTFLPNRAKNSSNVYSAFESQDSADNHSLISKSSSSEPVCHWAVLRFLESSRIITPWQLIKSIIHYVDTDEAAAKHHRAAHPRREVL